METEGRSASALVNVFNGARFSAAFGLGYAFNIRNNLFTVDVRYYMPITRSAMYTLNDNFDDNTFDNNKVFTLPGKTQNELYSPGIKLDDFSVSSVEITLSYLLFHHSAVSCFQAAKRCW